MGLGKWGFEYLHNNKFRTINEITLITFAIFFIAASGLPHPNSQLEGKVGFLHDSSPADGVPLPCVRIRGL